VKKIAAAIRTIPRYARLVLASGTTVMNIVLLLSAVVPVTIVVVGAWLFLRAGRRHDERSGSR
jgi:hypothetical protein